MSERRFIGFQRRSTALSLTLLVVVIAFPLFTAVAEPDHISIYTTTGQNQTRQDWGRYKFRSWAIGQTGFASKVIAQAGAATPMPSTGYPPSQPSYKPPRRHIVRGAGRGAALGAVGGAIAGDPAKGAAAGAAMGGTVGVIRRRDQRMQQNPPQ